MKLQDALQKIIRKYGTVILGEKRLVFLLDDYRSFADYPAVRPIMKAIAEDGYGKELCEAAEIHDMEFVSSSNDLKETLTEKHGFRKDLAEYAVSCISFAMGFEESVDEPLDHGFDPNGKTAPEPRKDESDENDGTSSDAAENPEGPESADEQYELGNAYFHGNGREKNCYEAVKWWRRAAEQGHAGAQYSLGFFAVNRALARRRTMPPRPCGTGRPLSRGMHKPSAAWGSCTFAAQASRRITPRHSGGSGSLPCRATQAGSICSGICTAAAKAWSAMTKRP